MHTLAEYPINQILPLIGFGKPPIKFEVNGKLYYIRASSVRLECFKRNLSCVFCKKAGNVWRLQTHAIGKPKVNLNCSIENCQWCVNEEYNPEPLGPRSKPHLNLYHKTKKGKYILMTRDHIFPKSKGGSEDISNMQTACEPCNQKKGASIPKKFKKPKVI